MDNEAPKKVRDLSSDSEKKENSRAERTKRRRDRDEERDTLDEDDVKKFTMRKSITRLSQKIDQVKIGREYNSRTRADKEKNYD